MLYELWKRGQQARRARIWDRLIGMNEMAVLVKKPPKRSELVSKLVCDRAWREKGPRKKKKEFSLFYSISMNVDEQ